MIPTKSEMNLENNKIVRPGLKKKTYYIVLPTCSIHVHACDKHVRMSVGALMHVLPTVTLHLAH